MKNKTKKKSGFLRNLPFLLIFIIGLGILLYPVFTQWYYRIQASKSVEQFDDARHKLEQKEIDKRIALAQAYNEVIANNTGAIDDPYQKKRHEEGVANYARMLEVHEQIGYVKIPKLLVDIPVYAGTSESVLQKGSGHLEGTSLPVGGNNTHTVLTAHRGLPEAELFTHLDKLQKGDKFYITNIKETLAYQVDQILTVDPGDFKNLMVVPGHDYATLLTCTPYMVNTHRLLVRGHRIPYVQEVVEKEMKENQLSHRYQIYFYITLGLLLALLIYNFIAYRRRKKEKQKESDRQLNPNAEE